jgi:hypothetical protein
MDKASYFVMIVYIRTNTLMENFLMAKGIRYRLIESLEILIVSQIKY